MIKKNEVEWIKTIKSKWSQFRHERNMPFYQGKVSPSWMTIIEREEALDKCLNILERYIEV